MLRDKAQNYLFINPNLPNKRAFKDDTLFLNVLLCYKSFGARGFCQEGAPHPLYAATLILPGGGYTSILHASGLKYCLETEAVI